MYVVHVHNIIGANVKRVMCLPLQGSSWIRDSSYCRSNSNGHKTTTTTLHPFNSASTSPVRTGWMPFLPPNQQGHSTEGHTKVLYKPFFEIKGTASPWKMAVKPVCVWVCVW